MELSCDDERNVTLVHAENGIGKTTLLNSVYWALFGEVTPRFEQRRRLVNFEAEQEGVDEASVEVEFEFDGNVYHASRKYSRESNTEDFAISRLEAGSLVPLPAPDTFINSVIPKGMARYFFFDGEHAESFAAELNTTAGTAIRSMLGCDLAELGIRDLEEVGAAYTRQMGSVPGDAALDALRSKLTDMEGAQTRDRETLADHRKTVEQKKEQRSLIEEELRRTAGAKEIQILRDTLGTTLAEVNGDLKTEEGKLIRCIGEKSIAVVSRKITAQTNALLDTEAAHGRIPRPYNEIFIQGLLSKERCICCRDLQPQTTEWAAVAGLLAEAGNADTMTRVIRAAARLRALQDEAQEAPRELETIQGRIAAYVERRRGLEQQIEQESKKLENFNLEEVREREAARISLGKDIENLSRDIWAVEASIERRQTEIDETAAKLTLHVAKNEKAKSILGKRSLAIAAATQLRTRLADYEGDARRDIQTEINKILKIAARRAYRFEFAEDFTMSLHLENVEGPVPKSGGENQLMSLSFTAALVDFARSRLGEEHAILSPGTVAPLVLDAPIGHLDKSYRSATAAFLPEMASQILLLLSSGHTEGGVLEALGPRIGRQYILVSENRGDREGRTGDEIIVGGVSYSRSLFNQERNQVRLVEVETSHA